MRKILIATDFSESVAKAAAFAANCFANEPVHYHLLYVSDCHSKPKTKQPKLPCKGKKCGAARIKLLQFHQNFQKSLNPKLHRSDVFFVDLPPVEALRKQVIEHQIDLIVIGCCGPDKKPQLGRFAQDVIIRVQCPFLIVPPNAQMGSNRSLAFATNFKNNYQSSVLNTLTDFTTTNDLKLKILHFSKSKPDLSAIQNANREFLNEFIEDPQAFAEIKGGALYAALDEYQQQNPIGILGLLAKNRSFCEQLLFKPTSNGHASVFENQLPVLLLHE
ncbi:universal stress protein [Gilvibacter sediminis]|uniref:universal stress protein n=1 Tax=Gilvibacter sediminis TaxID=379071 RepID=UPI002350252D|nr:universal stress protein [Gilvibacter sediminis]MDC7997468.1 universal stress protein [Gilvibacter sediminis]